MKKVIIVGSGIAALSVAALLSKKYDVEIFESNSSFGGKLGEKFVEDYRFDLGPSLFTYPKLLENLFKSCDENLSDFFEYESLEENCNYFFDDTTVINAFSNSEKLANEFASKTKDSKKSILKRLKYSAFIFKTTEHVFLDKSLQKLATFLNFATFKSALKLPFIGLFQTMHQKNKRDFKDEKTIEIFDRFATYNGSNPYKAPATLNVIPHLELNMGTYFPKNGMRSIAKCVYDLCLKKGVKFNFEAEVNQILIEQKKAIGIKVNDKNHLADIVISNADIFKSYEHLLPKKYANKKLNANDLSTSGIIFYWGVKKEFPQMSLHNIFFSKNYKEEFNFLFDKKELYFDPTIYVHISSKIKKDDAPKNCSNFFIMINVPATNNESKIEAMKIIARKAIIKKLNKILETDIEPLIETEFIRTPKNLEDETGAFLGALYGMNSNKINSAFVRHSNFHHTIKNLYFCGGTVHPGGGIPLAIKSANIVSKLISDAE